MEIPKIKVGDNIKIGFDASRCHIFNESNQLLNNKYFFTKGIELFLFF